jgi:hypothetical protein
MKLKIPWIDFITYFGLAIFAVGGTIAAFISGVSLPEGISVSVVSAAFVLIAFIVFFRWYKSRPDITTKHGTYIWPADSGKPSRTAMEHALDTFVANFPVFYPGVTSAQLERMLVGTCIEWTEDRVSAIGIGWSMKDKAGLQQGQHIRVQWHEDIAQSALFHELGHEVQEMVLRTLPDYKHEDGKVWDAINQVESMYHKINI